MLSCCRCLRRALLAEAKSEEHTATLQVVVARGKETVAAAEADKAWVAAAKAMAAKMGGTVAVAGVGAAEVAVEVAGAPVEEQEV